MVVLSPDLSLAEPLQAAGVPIVVIDKTRRWQARHWLGELRRQLRESAPGVIFPWMPAEGLMTWAAMRRLRGLSLLWSVRASALDPMDYDRTTRLVYALHRLMVKAGAGSGVVFNSFAGADHYGVAPNGRNRRVIWNALDFDLFRPDREAGHAWLLAEGFDSATRLVVSIGRHSRMKDHPTFLRAASIVLRHDPAVRFAVVGNPEPGEAARLCAAIRENGLDRAFRILGRRMDIPQILNAASVVVSTSRYGEGVQNSLAEAMACGRPLVATDVGDAARFLFASDSLVPPGDAEGVAGAILKQLAVDNEALTAKRVAHARDCFDPQRMRDELEDCLRSLDRAGTGV
jgi:glycosyltransferase involved in cell wall biosynthesis